jgi:hydroxymethylpyrimidine kinase/phosphomethylpyrimidine kinase
MADVPVALTIAGSDSGGGAGIQADLKTFAALGVFGTSAITCVTAQNPDAVTAIAALEPSIIERQIDAVCDGFPVAAAKTGMLYAAPIIEAVAATVKRRGIRPLVVDPVMVATSGARLLREDAIRCLCERLLPLCTVVTPNLPEAEILCGHPIRSPDELTVAAREISVRFHVACVAKGGHLAGDAVLDVLFADGECTVFEDRRIAVQETHGTGCTFSAALTAHLALGLPLRDAAREAKAFVTRALSRARPAGRHVPLNLFADA